MDQFTQALRDWNAFYAAVATASATLAGLLFVSLSLHPERIRDRGDQRIVSLARGSFGDFLYVLMLSLVFLVPHQAPIGLAAALFALGLSRGYGLLRPRSTSLRSKPEEPPAMHALRGVALPTVASLGLVLVGVEVLRGDMAAMYGLVLVVAALLVTASWNAWLILVAEDEPEE